MSNKQKYYKSVNDFFEYEQNKNKEHYDYNYEFKNNNDLFSGPRQYRPTKSIDTKFEIENEQSSLNMNWEKTNEISSSPNVWGPPLWFTFHNSSNKYPKNPSKLVRERMKHVIIGIPVLLPCALCKEHATAFIESHLTNLDDIVSTRDKLFNFFVDFHNQVNKRYGKKIYTYDEANQLYNKKGEISKLSYS
jgi:hypothetical protein